MRNIFNILLYYICFFWLIASCNVAIGGEINVEESIQIATEYAQQKKYDTNDADVEVLRVKKNNERGPIRMVWLMNNFSPDEMKILIQSEFWIVYFFPKGLIDGRRVLGGGFCIIVELYSGDVLFSFADQ